MPTDLRRTKGIHIYSPHGEGYRVEVLRELIRTYENGDSLAVPSGERRIERMFAELAEQTLPGGPVTLTTYSDLQNLLSACATAIADEFEAAAIARQAAFDAQQAIFAQQQAQQRAAFEAAQQAALSPAPTEQP